MRHPDSEPAALGGLRAKIDALPDVEKVERFREVIRQQGVSMLNMTLEMNAMRDEISVLRKKIAKRKKAI